jgi:D-tagatose-1,6-bisphosphate aldolase subunit GatZ/KbaZ
LISQYLPVAYAAMREGAIAAAPAELAMANVGAVLDQYWAAAEPARENAYA